MAGQAGTPLDASLETHVREVMARWHIPGAAVGEFSEGSRAIAGFGVTSLETTFPVRPDTLFQIGSITKLYTTTLLAMLVEDGLLDLDVPVITYLPDLKLADADTLARVTLRMLLCHSGGFYGDLFDDTGMGDDALARYLERLDTLPQQTPVGTSWAYCNAGFCIAGAVIERLTGQPYERVMRERVFEPLGLTHTFFYAHEAIAYPVSVGHTQIMPGSDEHEVARRYPLPRSVNAAGGIIANVDDLLTFAAFHLDGGITRDGKRLLPDQATRALWEPRITAANFAEAYATGWETRVIAGVQLIGHGGSTNGFNAQMILIPEKRYALAILTNSERGATMYRAIIAERLAERFGLRAPKPLHITLTAKELSRFAGVYEQTDIHIALSSTANGLRAEISVRDILSGRQLVTPPIELRPIAAREFEVISPDEDAGSRLDFLVGAHGRIRYLRMGGRLHDRRTRTPAQPAP
jgi:CubicO group peptidase (beta-lactamase class C family)